MKHLFPVTSEVFDLLKGKRRHLMVKDSSKFATGDIAVIEIEELPRSKDSDSVSLELPANYREQLEMEIICIEHGPQSNHVNSRYCLLGLYAPYPVSNAAPLPGTETLHY